MAQQDTRRQTSTIIIIIIVVIIITKEGVKREIDPAIQAVAAAVTVAPVEAVAALVMAWVWI